MTANLKALVQNWRRRAEIDFTIAQSRINECADELAREIECMESERQDGARTAETPETGALKACQFCESANIGIASDDPQETTGYVKCRDCGARGPIASDTETISAGWNGHRSSQHGTGVSEYDTRMAVVAFMQDVNAQLPPEVCTERMIARLKALASKVTS